MKLSLNKEYAIRHLGVAALFFGLSLYFLYDAIFVYPYLPADGPHHTTVEFQYTSAALLALVAFVVAFRVFLNWRATLAWDDEQMTGTLTLGVPLKFADIDHLDVGKWDPKQILVDKLINKVRIIRLQHFDYYHFQNTPHLHEL